MQCRVSAPGQSIKTLMAEVSIFAAAEWGENPSALAETKAAIDNQIL